MRFRHSTALFLFLVFLPLIAAQTQQSSADTTILRADPKPAYAAPKLAPEVEKNKRYAMELRHNDKLLEALPWFEKVVKAEPNDGESLEGLASCLLAHAANVKDTEQRREELVRTREILLQAKKLGYTSDYVETILEGIPADGGDATFSTDSEVNRLLKLAEADFSAGKFEEAKKRYLQALVLEPNNYAAVLFTGDVYFATKDYTAAGQWFSRAITIDANQEVAYRYWGDALLASGKVVEARHKYIEAVVAQPYARASWNGINKWSTYTKQPLTWYRIKSPNALEAKDSGNVNITIDSDSLKKKDGSSAWMMYEISRAGWRGEQFKKEFPNEKEYRHSLKEELSALSLVADMAESSQKKGEKLNSDLAVLVKLNKMALLEPYILLNAADQGIAQDYATYQKDHRDSLIRYLDEVVVPPPPK
jgi:tetratricopeptide (TPR) repeat protein